MDFLLPFFKFSILFSSTVDCDSFIYNRTRQFTVCRDKYSVTIPLSFTTGSTVAGANYLHDKPSELLLYIYNSWLIYFNSDKITQRGLELHRRH